MRITIIKWMNQFIQIIESDHYNKTPRLLDDINSSNAL